MISLLGLAVHALPTDTVVNGDINNAVLEAPSVAAAVPAAADVNPTGRGTTFAPLDSPPPPPSCDIQDLLTKIPDALFQNLNGSRPVLAGSGKLVATRRGGATVTLPLYVAPVYVGQPGKLGSVATMSVSYYDPVLPGRPPVRVALNIAETTLVNDTAVYFETQTGRRLYVWNGEAFIIDAERPNYKLTVCNDEMDCSAFTVDEMQDPADLTADLTAAADAALLEAGFQPPASRARRRLSEFGTDVCGSQAPLPTPYKSDFCPGGTALRTAPQSSGSGDYGSMLSLTDHPVSCAVETDLLTAFRLYRSSSDATTYQIELCCAPQPAGLSADPLPLQSSAKIPSWDLFSFNDVNAGCGPGTEVLNHQCAKPDPNWCTAPNLQYEATDDSTDTRFEYTDYLDCDADGVPDKSCTNQAGETHRVVGSASGCDVPADDDSESGNFCQRASVPPPPPSLLHAFRLTDSSQWVSECTSLRRGEAGLTPLVCDEYSTPWSGYYSGVLILDGHEVKCPSGSYLSTFVIETPEFVGLAMDSLLYGTQRSQTYPGVRFRYKCCREGGGGSSNDELTSTVTGAWKWVGWFRDYAVETSTKDTKSSSSRMATTTELASGASTEVAIGKSVSASTGFGTAQTTSNVFSQTTTSSTTMDQSVNYKFGWCGGVPDLECDKSLAAPHPLWTFEYKQDDVVLNTGVVIIVESVGTPCCLPGQAVDGGNQAGECMTVGNQTPVRLCDEAGQPIGDVTITSTVKRTTIASGQCSERKAYATRPTYSFADTLDDLRVGGLCTTVGRPRPLVAFDLNCVPYYKNSEVSGIENNCIASGYFADNKRYGWGQYVYYDYECCESWNELDADQCEEITTETVNGEVRTSWTNQYARSSQYYGSYLNPRRLADPRLKVACSKNNVLVDFRLNAALKDDIPSTTPSGTFSYTYRCCPLAATIGMPEPPALQCISHTSTSPGETVQWHSEDWMTTSLAASDGATVSCPADAFGESGVLSGFELVKDSDSAFHYELTCCTAAPPIADTLFPDQWGQWMPLGYSNGNWDVAFKVGLSTSSSKITASEVSRSLKSTKAMKMKVGSPYMSSESSATLSSETSSTLSNSAEQVVGEGKVITRQFRLQQGPTARDAMLWQWVVFLDGPSGHGIVYTPDLATTNSDLLPPCCAPTSYLLDADGNRVFDYRANCPFDEIVQVDSDGDGNPDMYPNGCLEANHYSCAYWALTQTAAQPSAMSPATVECESGLVFYPDKAGASLNECCAPLSPPSPPPPEPSTPPSPPTPSGPPPPPSMSPSPPPNCATPTYIGSFKDMPNRAMPKQAKKRICANEGERCQCGDGNSIHYGKRYKKGKPGSPAFGITTNAGEMREEEETGTCTKYHTLGGGGLGDGSERCNNDEFRDPCSGFYKHCICDDSEEITQGYTHYSCEAFCIGRGYALFGLQNGKDNPANTECYCAQSYEQYGKYGELTGTDACEGIGAAWCNSVYFAAACPGGDGEYGAEPAGSPAWDEYPNYCYVWATIPYCDVDSSSCCVQRSNSTPCSTTSGLTDSGARLRGYPICLSPEAGRLL